MRTLVPYLGENMAHASVESTRERLAIGAEISPAEVHELLTRLALGLNVFLGHNKATAIIAELRQQLEPTP